mmetsp:Transcript_16288/g.28471  ORF Transcript_16288/g.28471 Transcript_16288/m.28471 type:complete len:627 (+) Transcript_16288:66-1946(+)
MPLLSTVSFLIGAGGYIRREGQSLPQQQVVPHPASFIAADADSSSDAGWARCAGQGEECTCMGRVRWGNKQTWKYIDAPADGGLNRVQCNFQNLGDIIPGDVDKHCQCLSKTSRASAEHGDKPMLVAESSKETDSLKGQWTFCAQQWMPCECDGQVRWGNHETWDIVKAPQDGSLNKVTCNIQKLRDNLPGDDGKHCQCFVTHGSEYQKKLNPMLLTEQLAESMGSRVIASCELFEAQKDLKPEDRAQWKAVEPFCSQSWEDEAAKNDALKPGKKYMSLDDRRKLMRARVDTKFVQNYDRLTKDGWLDRAFVNYFAGAPGSRHAKMTEELIRSVHLFSQQPIFVLHLGSVAPQTWTPERFPNLILVHAAPMGPDSHRSFNFNKIRSFLLSRVRTGVELDSDQFVAPGVDYMFDMTDKEITENYSMPIQPVHFFSFTQANTPDSAWWPRFCPDPPACERHTMRWGHAHPTWKYQSLPFLGRWLRMHFRDELLPAVSNAAAMRVSSIPEDEDMLNVATWEERGTKQWCKFDNDYHEFTDLMKWSPQNGDSIQMGDIATDEKFYPGGAAKAFFTAHNCKDPEETAKMLDAIDRRYREGTYPTSTITFRGKIWKDGEDLRQAHPEMACIF